MRHEGNWWKRTTILFPRTCPVPTDDGACDHLVSGTRMPSVSLLSNRGRTVNIVDASFAKAVFFFYPRTGKPSVPSPEGWDEIPGARGCTPESCSYRDRYNEFKTLDYEIFGVSTQSTEDQMELSER